MKRKKGGSKKEEDSMNHVTRNKKSNSKKKLGKRKDNDSQVPAAATGNNSAVISKLLWMPIQELPNKQDLVGLQIRKKFSPGVWATGIITKVKQPTKARSKKRVFCTIQYGKDKDKDNESIPHQEDLPLEETLDHWIIAQEMYALQPSLDASSSLTNGKPSSKTSATTSLFLRTPRPGQSNAAPYTLAQFMKLLAYTEQGGVTIEDLEASRLIQNKPNSKATEVYGRMLPKAIDKILRQFMHLTANDCMVDIGHGIGNSCLQAAYTIGCHTRGIECDKARNAVANILSERLQDAVHIHATRDHLRFVPGTVKFRQGQLQDYCHEPFLIGSHGNGNSRAGGDDVVTHIFFDNWNGVFSGERGGSAINLERYVAAWFAMSPPGTIMCTVSPLRATLGCLPLEQATQIRQQRKLNKSSDGKDNNNLASYYEVQEFELGTLGKVYSFSEDSTSDTIITCYKYTRTHQRHAASSNTNTNKAVFLCNNPACKKAQQGIPIPAVCVHATNEDGKQAAVIGSCDGCNVSDRVLRRKKKQRTL